MNQQDIIKFINQSFHDVNDWFNNHDDNKFNIGPSGKWDTSQHLDHLITSAKMLNKGIRIPKFILKYKFGKPNRELRTLDQIKARYHQKLSEIPDDFVNPISSKKFSIAEKSQALNEFAEAGKKLTNSINRWSEKQLDAYIIPHPLLGRMLV